MLLMKWAPYNHAILIRTTIVIITDGKWISKKEQIFPEIHCCFHKKKKKRNYVKNGCKLLLPFLQGVETSPTLPERKKKSLSKDKPITSWRVLCHQLLLVSCLASSLILKLEAAWSSETLSFLQTTSYKSSVKGWDPTLTPAKACFCQFFTPFYFPPEIKSGSLEISILFQYSTFHLWK